MSPERIAGHFASAPAGLAATVEAGTDSVSRVFRVWNGGPGELAYTVSNDVPWCAVTPVASARSS